MKKRNFLLSVATGVGITVGMLGCSNEGVIEARPDNPQTQVVPARMAATYSPAVGDIPLPNDLLFGGTTDLTLEVPSADPTDFSDPAAALGTLDGWSAVAPFSISFKSRDENLAVDPVSVVGGVSVHLYKVAVNRAEVEPGIPGPTGPVTAVERELTANLEYVVQPTSGTSIAIIPLVPFEQQASYMVVLTNGLLDTDGQPILHDAEYAIAQSQTPIAPESDVAALEPVRQLVNAMEGAASAFDGGPARSDIILSYQFTIQSVGAVMQSAKNLYINLPLSQGSVPVTSFTNLGMNTSVIGGFGLADIYKGSIQLTYLLGIATAENPIAPLNTHWKALEQIPVGGDTYIANPLGENLSYANSFPRANGAVTVPLLVTLPSSEECQKPYPVTIFQHGITTNRSVMLPMADALAQSCRAAVSMDLPLHGIDPQDELAGFLSEGYEPGGLRERTFGIDVLNNETGAPGPDGVADASGAHTINLSNLLVARDNTRQAILDLLYLEQALAVMDIDGDTIPDFDTADVGFIGHSLGGMVGTGLIAYSGTVAEEPVPVIKAAALVNPGGGIAQMLLASPTFAPRIRAGLAGAFGAAEGTPEFDASLASFLFAAQTILDSSDPVNTAAHAVNNNVPVLMLQNLDDNVISNSVATAPLSGTEPLARSLALTTLVATEPGPVVGDRIFSKLNIGRHSSIVVPDEATAEMQTQVVSFLASGGAAVVVSDDTLLDD